MQENGCLLCLLCVLSLLVYTYWKLSRRHVLRLAGRFPGPKGWPVIGNALEFVGSSSDIFSRIYTMSFEYTKVLKLWVGTRLMIFITDPRDIELVLSSHVHIDKSREYRFFKPWLGDGLLISTGPKWRNDRKLIAPTFHLNVLKGFMGLFNDNSRSVVEKLRKLEGEVFDCHDYMSETTVEMLVETVMGVESTKRGCFEYAAAVMKMCDILHLRHTKFWLRSDFVFNLSKYKKLQKQFLDVIHSLTRKVIQEKKELFINGEAKEDLFVESAEDFKHNETGLSFGSAVKDDLDDDLNSKKRLPFLHLLLDAKRSGVPISDEDIKEQVDTIMFEGHDTTAAASSFFLSMMGVHQDVQKKVHKEMDEIFAGSDRMVTFADTLEMKYLERCLMETMRLYPPVPVIAREIKEDLNLACGDLTIPRGSTVIVATFKLHRNAQIYPNPDAFDPDNFLPEKTSSRHYYSFIPFSAGPRSCVGRKYAMLKLKVLLATIMRNFHVSSAVEEKDFKLQADIILKRAEGFKITLKSRK